MWRWGASVFGLQILLMLAQSVSWLVSGNDPAIDPQRDLARRGGWAMRFLFLGTWVGAVAWCVWREPSGWAWLSLMGVAMINAAAHLGSTFREVRRGTLLEAICALLLVFLAPLGWAFVFFYWPYLDGAGFFMGLVLPFSTAHFRDVLQADLLGLALVSAVSVSAWIREIQRSRNIKVGSSKP